MFEKVNPSHPDKIADRIAGAIVDLAYKKKKNPKIAVEVLLGHGICHIINETNTKIGALDLYHLVSRIAGNVEIDYKEVKQDEHLANNQKDGIKCGDNGIFKGCPVSIEQRNLTNLVVYMYKKYPFDGKYILHSNKEIICCQSNANYQDITNDLIVYQPVIAAKHKINPLGDWLGGSNVDAGATNRKLGSDMGDAVTGGGLHGKDLSKADVSVNIYCHQLAQKYKKVVKAYCAIGDKEIKLFIPGEINIKSVPYSKVVASAREYINKIGGFEKLAEWGLIR